MFASTKKLIIAVTIVFCGVLILALSFEYSIAPGITITILSGAMFIFFRLYERNKQSNKELQEFLDRPKPPIDFEKLKKDFDWESIKKETGIDIEKVLKYPDNK